MKTTQQYAIVVSEFNSKITHALQEGAYNRLIERGVDKNNIMIVKVPGAIEIPLATLWLAQSKKYQAIICLGAVIRGETNHYNYVCDQVSTGCQTIMLQYNMPVIFGVLTTDTFQQALDRATGTKGHKGQYAADAAIQMVKLRETICAGAVS
ncbi:MAG: 6,7-dimethyl-8-ribityllumazine synthase [Gammaproteobacteria bacterium RIFCSPHIGHO2_12_FULL_42_10]|nr:MAG: 6,7-dimethyl-8-ribityllumazine synthase [Gammaproteobacteria bacterium RIFCSPHIGHO2_12_FULL_42_10]